MRIEFDKEDKAVEKEIAAKRKILAEGSSNTDALIASTTKERKVPPSPPGGGLG